MTATRNTADRRSGFPVGLLLKPLLRLLSYGTAGAVLALLVVFVMYLNGRADLSVWHTAKLDEEFTAESPVTDFAGYLALEERLFAQLDEQVYAVTGPVENDRINRYKRGSLSDPERWSPNWNRSFEMTVESPRASVLLLHGLSDSPYSLRNLAERLHPAGVHVVGLRVPGHGTAPSGLLDVTWQDMAAAVRLAVKHLEERHGNQPIYIIGYSNGAALAVQYALQSLEDTALPRVDGLVLISPEIGVSAMAAAAIWQARIGRLLGLEKLAWNDILPEYDPFKYGSFAINAGDLSHRITGEVRRLIHELGERDRLGDVPPILAFSSAVDATVLAPALVESLFNRLPAGGHELVLFGINRMAGIESLLSWSPQAMMTALQAQATRNYDLSVVTNVVRDRREVLVRHWPVGQAASTETELGLEWPANVFSLSHVALTFPPNDPLYGGEQALPSPGIRLGNVALRGERGVLQISPAAMLRQRWNPFYPYLEQRTLEFLGLPNP